MWCNFAVNLLVVTLQKKLSSGSHKVHFNRKSDCWRYTHDTTLGGGHYIASVSGLRAPLDWSYSTGSHMSHIIMILRVWFGHAYCFISWLLCRMFYVFIFRLTFVLCCLIDVINE